MPTFPSVVTDTLGFVARSTPLAITKLSLTLLSTPIVQSVAAILNVMFGSPEPAPPISKVVRVLSFGPYTVNGAVSAVDPVPMPTFPSAEIRICEVSVPFFLVEKVRSAVLLASVEKSSIAIDCINAPTTLFAGAKYKFAVLLAVAFVLVI